MLSRSYQSSVTGRAAAVRRQRRRAHSSYRMYCGTNGCATFLTIDPEHGVATCPICGYSRHLS